MISRGGVSKAQKGLHLNEDIFAGMNATMRGGRIKHCEYYQCGKGRDLGFSTILGFASKIGAGMAEQMLSREQFQMGRRLGFGRLLKQCAQYDFYSIIRLVAILSRFTSRRRSFSPDSALPAAIQLRRSD